MKLALAVLALPLAAFVSGCSPAVSVRPLYTDADLKKPILEPRIEGEWISPDLDKAGTDEELSLKWKIDPPKRPGLSYSVEVRTAKSDPQEGEEVTSYNVRLVPIADKLFFDADFDEQKYEQHKIGRDAILGMAPAHLIGRVWVQQDFLRIALFDSDWVKDNSPESFREMVSASDTDIAVFTGSTAELRKFVLQNANNEKALSYPYVSYLCRPGAECAARAFGDALQKLPKDEERRDELLKEAANFYLIRGNFDRATELLRRRLELKPHDVSVPAALCQALLLKRDFAAARIEFAAAQKSALQESPSAAAGAQKDTFEGAAAEASEGIVWSYFLEGEYGEAVKAAADYKAADEFVSANPMLLRYFSLRHLGKRTEAEALLNEQAGRFKGPDADHLLLLDVQGRLIIRRPRIGPDPVSLKGDALQRSYFFKAMRLISDGQSELARTKLESALTVSDAPKNSLPVVAAKIELERLGPKPKK